MPGKSPRRARITRTPCGNAGPCDMAQAQSSASGITAKAVVPSQSDRKRAKKLIALGDQLANGRGMPRDEVKAAQLYQQAAELGDPAGNMRFGQALVFGR